MRLSERDEQIRCLDLLVAGARGGRGAVVVVDGPVACGRTELLRAGVGRARARGAVAIGATCSPAEQDLPFGVVSQLVRAAPVEPATARHLDELFAAADSAPLARLVHQVAMVLLELAEEQPVVVTVDDVRHADPESVHCLLYLVRRLESAAMVVVLGDDADQETRHSPLRAELLRQPLLHRLRVGPLSDDAVHGVVADRTDPATAQRLAPGMADASGGNPRLLAALLDDHVAVGTPRAQGYGVALLGCLHRAGPTAVAAARAMAVLGPGHPASVLGRVAGTDVAAAVRALTAAGLVRDHALRHDVAVAAVLEDVPPPDRAELHLAAAAVLFDESAPARRIAGQLVRAGRTELPWAAGVLMEAAEQALPAGDPAAAAGFLTAAAAQETDRAGHTTIMVRLAEAQWQLSPAAAGRHLDGLVERAVAGELAVTDQLTLARRLLWHGRGPEASGVVDRVRAATIRPRDRTELRAFEAWLTCSHPRLAAPRQTAAVLAPAPDLSGSQIDLWLLAAARLSDLLVRGSHLDGSRFAREVLLGLHLGRRTAWIEEAALLAVTALVGAGRLDDADQWCARVAAEGASTDAPTWPALVAAAGAEIALRRGDLTAAAARARAALTELPGTAWGVAIGYPLSSLVLAATRMGDHEDAARTLARVTEATIERMLQSRYGLAYLHARGHHHMATNHGYAALADFLSCGELVGEWGLDLAEVVPWRTSAAAAWLQLGNADQAKLLLYDQLGRPGGARGRGRGAALRLLAAASPAARRTELLTEALDLVEECGDRYEQARVLADLSDAHLRLGEDRRARMVSRRARHVAELCGALPLCQELTAADGDLAGPVPPGLTTLTGSERRVASLAVMGCTNREIAEKLHITASTVEQHLTRVYRKLEVKRRKDLPADLRADGTLMAPVAHG